MGISEKPCGPLLERTRHGARRPSADWRRDAFIRVTLQCLAEVGTQETGLREIGRRANASPGLLRHYFEGKQDLLQESFKALSEAYLQQIESVLAAGNYSAHERLRNYTAWYFGPALDDTEASGAYRAFLDQSRTDEELSAILRGGRERHHQRLAAVIREAIEGCDSECDPVETAAVAVAIFNGLWLDLCCDGTRLSRDQALETAWICLETLLSRRI